MHTDTVGLFPQMVITGACEVALLALAATRALDTERSEQQHCALREAPDDPHDEGPLSRTESARARLVAAEVEARLRESAKTSYHSSTRMLFEAFVRERHFANKCVPLLLPSSRTHGRLTVKSPRVLPSCALAESLCDTDTDTIFTDSDMMFSRPCSPASMV